MVRFGDFNPLNSAEKQPLSVEFNGIRADDLRLNTVVKSLGGIDNAMEQLMGEINDHLKRAADLANDSDAIGHIVGLDPTAEEAKQKYKAQQPTINVYQPSVGSQDQIAAARALVQQTHTLSSGQQAQPISGLASDGQFTIAA